jgi:putative SOS response-associated peptidase YedK
MEQIHNTKKRMPVILPREKELDWLKNDLSKDNILKLTKPFDERLMTAHPINKLIA